MLSFIRPDLPNKHQPMEFLSSPLFRILAIVVASLGVVGLARAFSDDVIRRIMRSIPIPSERDKAEKEQRVAMLARVSSNVLLVAIGIVAVLLVLGELNINLAPLLAGAGVIGIAIGFGAQSLVKDFLAGFFIVMEDQFAVDDVIKVKKISGRVESFTLRRTVIRDLDGVQHHVPNGLIEVVSNHTKDWSAVHYYVTVDVDEDFERVRKIVDEVARGIAREKEFEGEIIDVPHVLGIKSVTREGMSITVTGKTKPERHWAFKREMKARVQDRFRQEGVKAPHLRQVMVSAPDSEAL